MKFRETSSEESEEKSDSESDYEASESSDGNGDEDNSSLEKRTINTRRRAKSVMFFIPEATKMRTRNSRIIIREPTEPPILLGPYWQNRRPRNTARRPPQRFKNPIVASSSAANIVPDAVSSQAQVNNVNGGTIRTTSIPQVNVNTGNITNSFESGLNASSSSLEDFIFGSSSSGSNIKRPWNVDLNSATGPIPSNTLPFPLWSSSSSVQAHANITRKLTSSSQPLLSPAMPNYQQQHHPSSMNFSLQSIDQIYGGLPQQYLRRMAPLATAMQRPYDLRQKPPLLHCGRGLNLNQPANEDDNEKKVEKENVGLDLNQPANEDEKKDQGLDLNQPARDEW